jgi:hypothetical protein
MPNQDQNLNYGWHTQKLGATAGQTGFSQPANAPVPANLAASVQASAGAGYSPSIGAYGSNGALVNPLYAVSGALVTPGPVTPPAIPSSTVAQANPYGVPVTVNLSAGTVTVVAVAPANSATFTTVATSSPCTVTVPPGGSIKLTYSVVPTSWGWTLTI